MTHVPHIADSFEASVEKVKRSLAAIRQINQVVRKSRDEQIEHALVVGQELKGLRESEEWKTKRPYRTWALFLTNEFKISDQTELDYRCFFENKAKISAYVQDHPNAHYSPMVRAFRKSGDRSRERVARRTRIDPAKPSDQVSPIHHASQTEEKHVALDTPQGDAKDTVVLADIQQDAGVGGNGDSNGTPADTPPPGGSTENISPDAKPEVDVPLVEENEIDQEVKPDAGGNSDTGGTKDSPAAIDIHNIANGDVPPVGENENDQDAEPDAGGNVDTGGTKETLPANDIHNETKDAGADLLPFVKGLRKQIQDQIVSVELSSERVAAFIRKVISLVVEDLEDLKDAIYMGVRSTERHPRRYCSTSSVKRKKHRRNVSRSRIAGI